MVQKALDRAMKFVVITHVGHVQADGSYYAYGPYVREMNLWFRHVEEVIVVAPLRKVQEVGKIDLPYIAKQITFIPVPGFSLTSWSRILHAVRVLPSIIRKVYAAMQQGDHIHLRCPGNMGLIGCYVQMCFPGKQKIAKYAGNWDPQSRQPLTYQHQRWLLNHPLLSRNMAVLVYGQWPRNRSHVKSFFTASYSEKEMLPVVVKPLSSPIRLLFVGSLHAGKRPLLAAEVLKVLRARQVEAVLDFYGEGAERAALEEFIGQNQLGQYIFLHGNTDAQTLKQVYQNSHFLVFASISEGWPKVVAEAMFWGCLPITTAVSCVPEMVGHGSRGDILPPVPEATVAVIAEYMENPENYQRKALAAMAWSRQYTLEKFDRAIKILLYV
jgi:glycosyltransferase involved in cell wall biosynthesis